MAERIRRITPSLPPDMDRGPANNRAIAHTLIQFVVTAVLVLGMLVLLVQWNTIEVGDGEMPGPPLTTGALARPGNDAARALAARLRAERQAVQGGLVRPGHVTRRGLASLLIEINRNSGNTH